MGSVNKRLEKSFIEHWTLPALSNYKGATLTYGQLAERIELLHIAFRHAGLKPGDRVSVCGKNQANWTVAFLASMTGGYVPVSLLHEFHPDNISELIVHSDSKIVFTDESIWNNLDKAKMPELVLNLKDFTAIKGPEGFVEGVAEEFKGLYPFGFSPSRVKYHEDAPDEMAMINYTSGTSGFSKGVMLPYRALEVNMDAAIYVAEPQLTAGHNVVSILPCAHMYGLMFETLYEMTKGVHVHYLARVPSPRIIVDTFKDVKPDLIVAVPLIMEKVYKSGVKKLLTKYSFFFRLPGIGKLLRKYMCSTITKSFGSRFEEVILGGAPLNPEVESFLRSIGFRFTCGYGMTECAPLITYVKWHSTRQGSCGVAIPGMQIRIDSSDPLNVPGEVQVSGKGVFLGYFKNPEATAASFTEDGWLKTGDMGVLDADGYLYLRGRSKCMILGANGQNIYPEEIEATINTFPGVVDALVVNEKDGALVALIYPDFKQLSEEQVKALLPSINNSLPAYSRIRRIEVMKTDFERTPKKSIKRYLYNR